MIAIADRDAMTTDERRSEAAGVQPRTMRFCHGLASSEPAAIMDRSMSFKPWTCFMVALAGWKSRQQQEVTSTMPTNGLRLRCSRSSARDAHARRALSRLEERSNVR